MIRESLPTDSDFRVRIVLMAVLMLTGSWYLSANVDLYSYLPDDGAYAYVADRINQGDVLHRDIQDVHAGYINFSNAFALKIFGNEIVSLRYPILLLTMLQAGLMFWLLSRQDLVTGLLGGALLVGLTFIQFLNPTPHWYCLFLVICLAGILSSADSLSWQRILLVGAVVGCVFLFRQLTGVIVGCGALLLVLTKIARSQASDERAAVIAALVPVLLVLGLVIFRSEDLGSVVLIGTWPLAIVVWHMRTLRAANQQVIRSILILAGGFAISAIPIFAYHVWHGSLYAWWQDAFVAAVSLSGMDFIAAESFTTLVFLITEGFARAPGLVAGLNAVFWLLLILAPAGLGMTILQRLRRSEGQTIGPVVYLASFYALVSLHYQIPIYLMYSSALTLTGILLMSLGSAPIIRRGVVMLTIFSLAIGMVFHAAKPLSVSLSDILRGERISTSVDCDLPGLGIRVEPRTCDLYSRLLRLVDTHVGPEETILALPANPELYFLSGRKSALWFFNSALGIRSDEQEDDALASLSAQPPALVFYQEGDKYNTPGSASLVSAVMQRYEALGSVGEFKIFARSTAERTDLDQE